MNHARRQLVFVAVAALAMTLMAGCNTHVREVKSEDGKTKNVDIRTPMGELKVRTENVQARDVGLAVYPGAREIENDRHEESKANVNINTPWFGVKVVALKYESEDSPDKVATFYEQELQKSGPITRCRGDVNFKKGSTVECKDTGDRDRISIVSGSERRHRLVSIKPKGKGSEFAMVYVSTRGDDASDSM